MQRLVTNDAIVLLWSSGRFGPSSIISDDAVMPPSSLPYAVLNLVTAKEGKAASRLAAT
jgi:hypothetical protein